MPNPFRVRRPAPQLRVPDQNIFVHDVAQQIRAQEQMRQIEKGAIAAYRNPRAPLAAKAIKKPSRALPNGRMKNVKLGDIFKAYMRIDNPHQDKYEMIDFRPVRVGDYFLTRKFAVEMADNSQMIALLRGSPRIIMERIKGEAIEQEEEYLFRPARWREE